MKNRLTNLVEICKDPVLKANYKNNLIEIETGRKKFNKACQSELISSSAKKLEIFNRSWRNTFSTENLSISKWMTPTRGTQIDENNRSIRPQYQVPVELVKNLMKCINILKRYR
ncbi:uncharacterized protein LOC119682851 [Teleopsis dalmanni]|uniref:uncharacterized protein LOC119682851 n=1 Tax=Teleopsis dalmanni TaxID=139649 RepID=UPI0018CCA715|nr:uncharacterized protein LOC119682851 [Teleopsis dalmanni]